ncbi:MAG: CHASE3 domain-containing protein, partial [Streptosporangiaceae bacterium]
MDVHPGTTAWTTRRWLLVGVSLALAVLAALSVLGWAVLAHATTVNTRLVDRSSPALLAALRLETAFVNQETGIRGYGLTGQSDFLEPYTRGLVAEKASVDSLRELADGDRAQADLKVVLDRAGAWQSMIARPVATAPLTGVRDLARQRALQGKGAFDALRAALNVQQDHLMESRLKARSDLLTVRFQRNLVFGAILAMIVALAGLLFEGLRRGVTYPLERLAADTERVADGEFDHPIGSNGPADLQQVAGAVERMRQRLTEELAFTDTARDQLAVQAADLQRSNAELEQFAYVASHDLQEPLRKVASFCQLLQRRYEGQLDERADQYIEFAVDGANRMQTLINDLLQFSRVGRVHDEHSRVDLEEILTVTLNSIGIAIQESGAEVTHDPLPEVAGDETQFGMLMQNLVSNAIKFRSPDRPVRIHLSVERVDDEWRFAVTDTGIGIDPEYAERVFVIFQRLHNRDAYPGNGIGLAMCKKIV